jgi:hypothetical protein
MLVVAQFTQGGGAPATGLTLTDIDLYLWRRNKVTGAIAAIWSPQNPSAEVGAAGQYVRSYAEDLDTYDYFAYAEYTGVAALDSDYSYQGGLPAECVSRNLAVNFTQLQAALKGNDLEILRGDTLDLDVTRLGDISTRSKLWFTIKDDKDDADTLAQVQIEESAGLLYIAGAAATIAGNGSITITDAANGDITIVLAAVETAKLVDTSGSWYWDVQVLTAAGVVQTLARGRVVVIGDVTRATS